MLSTWTISAYNQALCIALTKTHLSVDINDAEIHITLHAIFRTDKTKRTHAGVTMNIREDATSLTLLWNRNTVCDTLIVHLKQIDKVICTLYHTPDASKHKGKIERSLSSEKEIHTKLDQRTITFSMSDFKLPKVKWPGQRKTMNDAQRTKSIRIVTWYHENAIHGADYILSYQVQ